MINEERLLKVLLAPNISEKATTAAEANNTVVFKVATDATKAEIKAAVEKLFEVTVEGVNTLNVKGKVKRTTETSKSFSTAALISALVASVVTLKTTVLFASAATVAFSEIFGAKSTFNKRSSFIMLVSPQFL